MKIIDMRTGSWNKTKAFFSIETEEGMVIKNFKIINGTNGLFISAPSTKNNKDGKWWDNVIIPEELKDKISNAAIKLYERSNPDESNSNDGMPF
jgi:DNA-binding cell septation regulator SpoVG